MQRSHLKRQIIVLVACCLAATTALADNQALLDAERFAARGRLAAVAGAHSTAGAAFEKAYAELSDPAYLFSAGEAYEEATAWASAARVFTILANRPLPEEQLRTAKEQLAAATARLEGIRSRLAVHIAPPGAQVEVNGQALPFGNPASTWVEEGSHVVRVSYPGFNAVERVVEVSLESPSVMHIDLERVSGGIGTLQVSSNIDGARVTIDGNEAGFTPLGVVQRPQGIYEVKIEKEGYQTWERSVSVQKDLPTEVVAKLEMGNDAPVVAAVVPVATPAPAPEVNASVAPALVPVATAPALVPMGGNSPAPEVKEVPLVIQSAAPVVAASSEAAPPVEEVAAAPAPILAAEPAAPAEAPPLVIQEAAPEEPAVIAEPVEVVEEQSIVENSFSDDYEMDTDTVSETYESDSGGGGGDPFMIGLGWGLAGLGAVVAGGGYYFTMEAASAAEARDAVPLLLPASGEYNPGGQYSPDNPEHVAYWNQSLFPYYWGEADTEASANTMLSYVMYGTGGAILVTGVTLAIMGHMDSGGGDYAESQDDGPTWTGFQTGPTKDGWGFSSSLRF